VSTWMVLGETLDPDSPDSLKLKMVVAVIIKEEKTHQIKTHIFLDR
jgi:hypothetical protein